MKPRSLVTPKNDPKNYGIGVVLESVDNKSYVFFPNVGRTIGFVSEYLRPAEVAQDAIAPFANAYAQYTASGVAAPDFCATGGVRSTSQRSKGASKRSPKITITGGLKGVVEFFINKTKGGFRSEIFIKQERSYRIKASENFLAHFNQSLFASRLEQGNFSKLANELMVMISAKNHGFNSITDQFGGWSHHKNAVCNCEDDSKRFCEELYGLLYCTDKAVHFDNLVHCFSKNNTPQWPAVTAFLALLDYKNYLCVKPGFIKQTCDNVGVEYMGNGGKNWTTYEKFLGFGLWLRNEIAKIPNSTLPVDADMLDMQAFIYAVSRDFEY